MATLGKSTITNLSLLNPLEIKDGGTGASSFTAGTAIIGNGANAFSTRAITDNTSKTAVTANTNLITANTLYYHSGNSNITTVGTITSGTWQGSKIANAYLTNSSMTIAGNSVSLGGSLTADTLKTSLGLKALAYKDSLAKADVTNALGYTPPQSVPTTTSQLTNDSGFATETWVQNQGYKTTDNNTTYTIATGDSNGQIKVTPSSGSAYNVSVKGLGALAYKASLAKGDVGLGNVDNTADSAKSVKYATSAGTASALSGGYINIHPENSPTIIPFIHNDLAFLSKKGGSYKVYQTTSTNYTTASLSETSISISGGDNMFDGSPSYAMISTTGEFVAVIDMSLHKTFQWSNMFYVDFGANGWRAKNIAIYVMNSATETAYTLKNSITNNTIGNWYCSVSHSSTNSSGDTVQGFNKLRVVLSGFNNTSSTSGKRIAQVGLLNYGSFGVTETFISRGGCDGIYGSLIPYTTTSYDLGSSSKKWSTVYATTFNGNATSATKATQDGNGNVITSTYATVASLSNYATKSEIPNTSTFATKTELSGYAKTTDIPDVSNFITSSALSDYATTASLSNYLSKTATGVQSVAGGLVVGASSDASQGAGRIMLTGSTNPLIGIRATGGTAFFFQSQGDIMYLGPTSSRALAFTGSTGDVSFPGNVTIGTSSANKNLTVNGNITTTGSLTGNLTNKITIFGSDFNNSANVTIADTNLIASISEGTSTLTDSSEILTSYASDNGFNDSGGKNKIYKRKASKMYDYIKGKLDSVYMSKTSATFSGNVTAPTFIGALQGTADYATSAGSASSASTAAYSTEAGFANNGNYYGVCDTAQATLAKEVTIANFPTTLQTGQQVTIKFTNASANSDSSSPMTLNVSGTGAYTIYRYGTTLADNGTTTSGWIAGAVQTFTFDGNGWVREYWNNTTYSNVALGQGYATCSTAADTTAKTASLSSYSLTANGIVSVKFTNSVPAGATLNINSKGAKAMYYRGSAITAGIIEAGDTATFIYNTYYHLISVDKFGGISGVTVNGSSIVSNGIAAIPEASTSAYGVTKLSSATNSTSTTLAATASAVKAAYDLAASKVSNNGTGTNSVAIGYSATATNTNSVSIGTSCTASGENGTAIGCGAVASGLKSVAIGDHNTASGEYALATGCWTNSNGIAGTTFGNGSTVVANSWSAMASGIVVTAKGLAQHVFGSYNIPDADVASYSTPAEHLLIVGNGDVLSDGGQQSNAMTLDWSGNAWFSGDVYVGSTSGTNKDSGSVKLAKAATTLSGYGITDAYTKSDVYTKTESDSNYIGGARSTYNVNTLYNAGIWMTAGGTNCPSGSQYGVVLGLPYRKLKGNSKPDFGAQIFLPNGDDSTKPNTMFYRTSGGDSWNAWQEIAVKSDITGKQDALVSGTNIKTINGQSILGSGNLSISGGGSGSSVFELDTNTMTQDTTGTALLTYTKVLSSSEVEAYSNASKVIVIMDGEYYNANNKISNLIFRSVFSEFNVESNMEIVYSITTTLDSSTNICTFEIDITVIRSVEPKRSKTLYETTSTNISMNPNIYYRQTSTNLTSLNISLYSPSDNTILNEYFIEFTTPSTGTAVTLPTNIKWANGEAPVFENNCTYQISIINNLGVVTKFL